MSSTQLRFNNSRYCKIKLFSVNFPTETNSFHRNELSAACPKFLITSNQSQFLNEKFKIRIKLNVQHLYLTVKFKYCY
jgi:hypothetical protein